MLYSFKDFELDSDTLELKRAGEPVHSEPQVIELLNLLVQKHEQMISKDEILESIWKDRVVSESALSSRIKTLRQLLGDDGRKQEVIQTIHKRGFRFVAPVTNAGKENQIAAQNPHAISPAEDLRARSNSAVIVLPFANLSNEPGQDYLCDGLTTDIIAHLSKHRWLDVVARNTAFGFKGQSVDISQIGKDLAVAYAVEGTVQKASNRVRITVNLINTELGHSVWTERYDREIEDIFELQDEITEKIVARLEPEIGYAERNKVVRFRPKNLKAWDCFHLGLYHFYKFTAKNNIEAQNFLKQSWQMDEQFGEAHAFWAYAVVLGMVYWDTEPTVASLNEALTACDKAVSLDRQNATFYALRARVLLAMGEYDMAIAENNIAIRLNPTLAVAYCALGDSLAYVGRYDEAINYFEKSILMSPNDPQLWAFYTYGALALIFKEDFETALCWLNDARSIPNYQYWTDAHRIVAYAKLGRINDAKKAAANVFNEVPNFSQDFVKKKFFFIKDTHQVNLYLHGLSLAEIS